MDYRIILAPRAEKELDRLPVKQRTLILSSLEGLVDDPYIGKKLKGELQGCYSLRVWPYRVIYLVVKKDRSVLVIRIAGRARVYR